jgi:pimeloyl-ACP methyl ester carboxylesterase
MSSNLAWRGHSDARSLAVQAATFLRSNPGAATIAATGIVLAVSALVNHRLAKKAERDNPPAGRLIKVDGVRMHFVEKGAGEPLVLLHGNGTMIQDFETSGLMEEAAMKYRVIAFDRPGFGHSTRPRSTIWTPARQAELINRALSVLGVQRATVLGHSWGCSVAIALALNHPATVSSLVLASGYYYPTARGDVIAMSPPALPVVGDVIRYCISPILSRLLWPLVLRKLFGPAPVPQKFSRFPKEMTCRPSQIRASAEESALMLPDAFSWKKHYPELKLPVVIIVGAEDRLIAPDRQSARLHAEVLHSTFHRVRDAGHMVHQTAPKRVMAAVEEATQAAKAAELPAAAE